MKKCSETRWNDGKFWTDAHIDRRGYHWPFEPGRCPAVTKETVMPMVSTFDLIKRIEEHVLAIRRAPFSSVIVCRSSVVIAEQALASVVAHRVKDKSDEPR